VTSVRGRGTRTAVVLAVLGATGLLPAGPARAGEDAASAPTAASAASSPVDGRGLNRQAGRQAKAGDAAGLHETLVALAPLMPGSATVAYNLAATAARLGHADEALGQLRRLADAGLHYELAKDEDFAALAGDPAFRALRDRLAGNAAAVGASRTLAAIGDAGGLPESLAWDAAGRRLFVSDVRHCEVRVLDDPRRPHPRERRFARLPASAFALGVDRAHGRLWVTVATVRQADGCGEGSPRDERTALLALDLRSARVVQRVEAGVAGVLGDLAIADDGTVYAAESLHGAVLRLRPGAKAFERLDAPGDFASPQMPAPSADGRTLYVPDYARGVAAIDLANPAAPVRWLAGGEGVFTAGIDGFVRTGDGFLAVQNGLAPPRVIRFAADFSRQQVLEAGTPGLGEPTHAIVVDGQAWFIADVGWDRLDDHGHARPGTAPARPQLRALPLVN